MWQISFAEVAAEAGVPLAANAPLTMAAVPAATMNSRRDTPSSLFDGSVINSSLLFSGIQNPRTPDDWDAIRILGLHRTRLNHTLSQASVHRDNEMRHCRLAGLGYSVLTRAILLNDIWLSVGICVRLMPQHGGGSACQQLQ